MTIPHRPLGVIDISDELGEDGPLGLRDEAVMQLAGIPEYQDPEVLVVPDHDPTGPQGPLCVVRDDQGIDHPIMDVGIIDGTDIVVTREISMSHGGQDVRIQITGTDIVAVVEWGSPSGWEHPVHGMSFKGCTNLVSVPDTLPEWVADCREMFYGCGQFNDPAIVGWDVSRVKDMGYMFFVATSFNQDLSGWSVGHFSAQPDGFDQGASSWVLSRPRWSEVTGMAVNKSSIQVLDLEGKEMSIAEHRSTESPMVNLDVHAFFDSPTEPGDFMLEILHEISSSGAGTPALQSGTLPAGSTLTLIVKDYIRGAGGNGGTGNGHSGGTAVHTTVPTTIDVTAGYVWGGGGGGEKMQNGSGAGGAGGGAGKVSGQGSRLLNLSIYGGNGTLTSGGAGYGPSGGNGGDPGMPGAIGKGAGSPKFVGGAAGPSIQSSGHPVTWIGKTVDRVRGPEV